MNDEYMNLDEAASKCNVTRAAIYNWHKSGKLKLYKKGRFTMVKRSDIERIQTERETIRPID